MTDTAGGTAAAQHGTMRSGDEYLRALRDGRRVYVDGERVADVTTHPAFREAARSIARLFDIAAAPENRELMTYPSPKTGAPVWRAWQIPKSHADLRAKRLAAEKWAEATFGLMGRTPDHVAGFIAGYAAKPALVRGGRPAVRRQPRQDLRASARQPSSTSPMRSCRRRSTAASRRMRRGTRRFMPASSRSATTAS